MDKSDLLEEWDVVSVSSVYEAEKENSESETEIKESEKANVIDETKIEDTAKENAVGETKIIETENRDTKTEKTEKTGSDNDSKIEETEKVNTDSGTKIDVDVKNNGHSSVDTEANTTAASANINSKAAAELENTVTEIESQGSIDAELERNILTKSECNIEPDYETIIAAEHSTAVSELENIVTVQPECSGRSQSEDSAIVTKVTDLEGEISDVQVEEKPNVDTEHDIDAPHLYTEDDNILEDIVHVENPVNNNIDGSLMMFETGSDQFDIQDTPELVPDRIEIEQEMAAIESSSSDIDILDENVEESVTSSFISPLSLSLSSSVADAPSIRSFASQSDDGQDSKPIEAARDTARYRGAEERGPREDKGESAPGSRRGEPRNRRSFFDWFFLLAELLRNMSGYDWCIVGGVAVSLYLTVVVNQTNIFAVVHKENVVSQMKDMINELKNDNKMLKEHMLSELKNKKALSSFEHQIRELRKENSKLSHMLYDVAKVLDKQKNSHAKKEADYQAPFKMEINQLKEHINTLKFDNEELQKELVRMRYGSFAQGAPDATESKDKKGKTQAEESVSAEEIPQDLESLKKWNELITLLTQELGTLSGADGLKNEKSQPGTENEKPFWKAFFTDFKGTFNDLRKINFTAVLSDYRKANQKAMTDVYRFVKDFFTAAEHTQQEEESSQWKNIGDFVSDLKEKWTNIKGRLYASDLRQFFEKAVGEREAGGKTTSAPFQSEKAGGQTTSAPFQSEKKHDPAQATEETKWMFERAAHREELRNEEDGVNWYLKKGRRHSDDEKDERRF